MADRDNQQIKPPQAKNNMPAKLKSDDIPALFWDEMPDDPDNPDMAAIQAIIDESTPEERAISFKNQGNEALKVGLKNRKKFYLRQAIEQYTEGLNLLCSDAVTNSLLYSNRAHVNLLLGNFRNAMLDGQDAAKADPTNVKAYYRAAKGALGLSKYDECRSLCTQGLKLDPGNMDLQTTLKAAKEHSIAEAQRAMELAQQAQQARAPATALADILLAKPWQIGCPQFTVGTRKPRVDKAGDVYWPVLLFYPEAGMGSDTVEDWKECDAFEAHLDVMFGPKAPPLEWDAHGAYARQHIQVYYLSYAAEPLKREELIEALYGGWPEKKDQGPARYGEKAARWIRVEEGWTLGEVLRREDHVVPGVPVFFVLSAKTPFKESFLEGDIPLL